MQVLKEFLTRNRFAKVFSIVLATLLWMTISRQANSEIGISIPLEYRNIPSQLEVIGDTTDMVEVRLRGPATLIREMTPQDISATIDLADAATGEKIVQLTPKNVRIPFGIEIVRVSPSQVRLSLDRTMSKSVPVTATLSGEPESGTEVEIVTINPLTVEVQGPESKVRSIESVPTAPINLAGRKSSFTGIVDLDLPDDTLRLQHLSPVQVHVKLKEHGSKE